MKLIKTPLEDRIEYEIKYSIDGIENIFTYSSINEILLEELIDEIISKLVYETCDCSNDEIDPKMTIILKRLFKNNIKIISFKATESIKIQKDDSK